MKQVYDIGIIGAGPVGIYSAFYAGYHGLSSVAFDTFSELGGQLVNLYPEKWIFDVGGHVKIFARDYINSLIEQATPFDPIFYLGERIEKLEAVDDSEARYRLISDKREVLVKAVLIAGGMGAFLPRKLELPNLAYLEEHGVHYRVLSKERFRDRRVMIVGGGDSAVDWAINLQGVAKEIWAVHRSPQFKALEANVTEMLHETETKVLLPYEVKQLHGEDNLEAVTLIHSETQEECRFEVDDLLLMIGLMANLGPIQEWGLQIKWNGLIVDRFMQTNYPAVYAVGDIAKYDGKVNLIAAGNGEAATAIEHAIRYYLNSEPRPRDWLEHDNPHDR